MDASVSDPPQASRAPLPADPATFDADDRVSFSKLSETFILEAEDGQEFEWERALKRWVPVFDDTLLEQQQQAYAVQGVDEAEPAAQPRKKRKKDHADHDDHDGTSRKPRTASPRERKNTAAYVSNLPPDTTADEVASVFSKCGVIAESMESKTPRVKLYTDAAGAFKGDALIVYFRGESVALAVQMLDDTDFRLGAAGPAGRMRVAPAEFKYKAQKEVPAAQSEGAKKQVVKKTQKLNSKLADWDDDDVQEVQRVTKWQKTVVLKHMFTLEELKEDPAALIDIEQDIQEECGKLGNVTKVTLYDKEEDGIVTVRFSNPASAEACARAMNGRFFGGTRCEAYVPEGRERFQKSGKYDEDEDEELLGSGAVAQPVPALRTGLPREMEAAQKMPGKGVN